MELKRTYIRTDKNGTKHYDVTYSCEWCRGTGIRPQYMHVFGGVCFYCDGSGFHTREVKEYTAEYAAKLEAKRKAKQEAREAEEQAIRDAWNPLDEVAKMGFGEKIGIVVDAKTGKPVERCERRSGWLYFDAKCKNIFDKYFTTLDNAAVAGNDEFQIVPMDWTDVFVPNRNTMTLEWNQDLTGTFQAKYVYDQPQCPVSKAVGKVGERVTVDAAIKEIRSYDTFYGTKYFYVFQDKDFNLFCWETGKDLGMEAGTAVKLTGTVTEHDEHYQANGCVTHVNRCKVA